MRPLAQQGSLGGKNRVLPPGLPITVVDQENLQARLPSSTCR
jgi:hypothetical protein